MWTDCGSETYAVTGVEIGTPELRSLLDQPASGFTLFIRPAGSPVTLVIHAENPVLLVTPSPNPSGEAEPTEAGIQAEITFGESGPSPDGQSYQMAITVKNTGSQAIRVSLRDISLTPEEVLPLFDNEFI